MKIEIIKDENGKSIGWEMSGENPEELRKLRTIRDLQFWGCEEYAIDYNGRKGSDDANGNPGILSWKQKKFISH